MSKALHTDHNTCSNPTLLLPRPQSHLPRPQPPSSNSHTSYTPRPCTESNTFPTNGDHTSHAPHLPFSSSHTSRTPHIPPITAAIMPPIPVTPFSHRHPPLSLQPQSTIHTSLPPSSDPEMSHLSQGTAPQRLQLQERVDRIKERADMEGENNEERGEEGDGKGGGTLHRVKVAS